MKVEVNAFELLRLLSVKIEEIEMQITTRKIDSAMRVADSIPELVKLLKPCLKRLKKD